MDLRTPLAPLSLFALDPMVLHLNHGSFGASARAALDVQAAMRARLEAAPMRFMVREWQGLLDDRRDALRPLVTSHGETPGVGPPNRFHARFDWSGTHDPTSFLAIPAAIEAVAGAGGGWPAIRERNRALALAARDLLVERLGGGAAPIAPDEMHGSMAAIPIALPAGATPLAFQAELIDRSGIEIPIVDHPTYGTFVRISAHVYNALPDYARLADELRQRGVRGRALG